MKPQVGLDHYFDESYDTKERFISYWHQINEIIKLSPKRVLEVGVGTGFVSKYLRERTINVVTLDFEERLTPDVVGSVLDIPFPKASFEIVACFELLEHMPYEDFQKALFEIFRVTNSYVILSLPDINRAYRFNLQIPKFGEIKILIPLPRLRKPVHKFDGQHYWEIGKNGYPLSKIIGDIRESGFAIEKSYRPFEYPYHRFFILRK